MQLVALIGFSYLLGSIPSGYILGKFSGVDVRQVGSGNIGASNVARALGKWQGALTLVADALKGALPAALGIWLALAPRSIAGLAAAAFLGHLYPIFLKFRGGKGVATALGAMLVIAPPATALLVALFAVVVMLTRLVSLSSMIAAAAAPLAFWMMSQPKEIVELGTFIAAMIVWRHRGNIQRLLAGTEPRFGSH